MQSCHVLVRIDTFLREDDTLLVPTKLKSRLNQGHEHGQLELSDSHQLSALLAQRVQSLLIVVAVVFDEVPCDLIYLEGLFELLIRVERVALALELLSIGQLVHHVSEVVCQVAHRLTILEECATLTGCSPVVVVLGSGLLLALITGPQSVAFKLLLQVRVGSLHGRVRVDAGQVPIRQRL